MDDQESRKLSWLGVGLFVLVSRSRKKDMSGISVSVPGKKKKKTGRDNLEVACTRFERTKEILANNIF